MSAVESSPGIPGAARQLLVGHQHPSTQLQEAQYQFIVGIISLIINIISIINVISILVLLVKFLY